MPKSATPRLGWRETLLLLAGYLVLDWASHVHPMHGLDVTPWSPAPALGLLYLVRYGGRAVPPLALAILAADAWVRNLPLPWPLACGLAVQLSAGYWVVAMLLRRRLGCKGMFADRRGLIDWFTIALIGTLLNSLLFIAGLTLAGFLPPAAAVEVFLHYWLSDVVGVLISMPLLAMLLDVYRGSAERVKRDGESLFSASFARTKASIGFGI